MEASEYSINTEFKLTPKEETMIRLGLDRMKNSEDPEHGLDHLSRMFEMEDEFANHPLNSKFMRKINRSTVQLSIAWHDTWKSRREPAIKGIKIFLDEIAEGLGSMFLFSTEAQKVGLDPIVTKDAMYAIRKHSVFNLLPRFSLDSQLLYDLDVLEMYDPLRYISKMKALKYGKPTIEGLANRLISHRDYVGFYFDWTKNKFEENKKIFLTKLQKHDI